MFWIQLGNGHKNGHYYSCQFLVLSNAFGFGTHYWFWDAQFVYVNVTKWSLLFIIFSVWRAVWYTSLVLDVQAYTFYNSYSFLIIQLFFYYFLRFIGRELPQRTHISFTNLFRVFVNLSCHAPTSHILPFPTKFILLVLLTVLFFFSSVCSFAYILGADTIHLVHEESMYLRLRICICFLASWISVTSSPYGSLRYLESADWPSVVFPS